MGKKAAFLTIWLQWINTVAWYPTILSFIAGTSAYLIDPNLAQHKGFLVVVILTVFWTLTLLNLKSIKISATVASLCALFGMVIPMLLIIILGFVWLLHGEPLQIHITSQNVLPSLSHSESWISLTAIITSFLGMELACVHVKDIEEPNKNFPRSLIFSIFFILATMILGSIVIAWVLPQHQIHFVDGTMQVFRSFFVAYHMQWLLPLLAFMTVIGSVGGMINWMISPVKGLLFAAKDQFLPPFFCKVNKHGVAQNLVLMQGCLVSLMCLAFVLMPSVNGSYWLLTDLSTQMYVMMYVFLFVAALVFKFKNPDAEASFKIWGNKWGMALVCTLGLIGCAVSLFVGFLPPDNINVGGAAHYVLIFVLGLVVMIAPVLAFFWYHQRSGVLKTFAPETSL